MARRAEGVTLEAPPSDAEIAEETSLDPRPVRKFRPKREPGSPAPWRRVWGSEDPWHALLGAPKKGLRLLALAISI